jgi:transposase
VRLPFEKVDIYEFHGLELCPACGGELFKDEKDGRVIQQVEVVPDPIIVTEHESGRYFCEACKCSHQAKLPDSVEKGGLLGPRLTSLVGWGRVIIHSTVERYLDSVLGLKVSRGLLAKAVQKCSDSLAPAWENLLQDVKQVDYINVDETGHKG